MAISKKTRQIAFSVNTPEVIQILCEELIVLAKTGFIGYECNAGEITKAIQKLSELSLREIAKITIKVEYY